MNTETLSVEKTVTKTVKEYDLIVFNDDFNTFDFVIESLVKICKHTAVQAEQCTMLIHYTGKCQVKTGDYEQISQMCTALLDCGINSEIQ